MTARSVAPDCLEDVPDRLERGEVPTVVVTDTDCGIPGVVSVARRGLQFAVC